MRDKELDVETLALLRQKKPEGIARAFEKYGSRILNFCFRMLSDREEAEDATQEVFLSLWQKSGGLFADSHLSSYIYRLARNGCLNRLRRRKILRILSLSAFLEDDDFPRERDIFRGEPGLDVSLEKRELSIALARALSRLPASQRAVLALKEYDELPQGEIARIMETSVGAVEALLSRARKNLANLLYASGH